MNNVIKADIIMLVIFVLALSVGMIYATVSSDFVCEYNESLECTNGMCTIK